MLESDKLLTIGEVAQRTRMSKPTIYKLMRRGQFPKQLHLCENKVAWLEREVEGWVAARADARVAV